MVGCEACGEKFYEDEIASGGKACLWCALAPDPAMLRPGDIVEWSDDAPPTWRFIYGPGPMRIISVRSHCGSCSPPVSAASHGRYDIEFAPGPICRVEHSGSGYYHPDDRALAGDGPLRMDVHEMWLRRAGGGA